jgi:transcriptional regulator with XRE-family HTH domain
VEPVERPVRRRRSSRGVSLFPAREFGAWLRLKRGEVAQAEVARRSGISQGNISKLETGEMKTTPDAGTVTRLAAAVDASALEALAVAGMLKLPDRDAQALKIALDIYTLSERDRAILLTLVEEMKRRQENP